MLGSVLIPNWLFIIGFIVALRLMSIIVPTILAVKSCSQYSLGLYSTIKYMNENSWCKA